MFRSFISWRYLLSRRTNLIGVVGIFVAVAALIMILSIMTGFLDESRKTVRGSLADLLIEPLFESTSARSPVPRHPAPLLEVVRARPEVAGAAAEILWGGLITQGGQGSDTFARVISSATYGGLLAVQLVGIDLLSAERLLQPLWRCSLAAVGGLWPPLPIQDEFDATELLRALQATPPEDPDPFFRRLGLPVENPLFPFAPPRGYEPEGRPAAGAVVGYQLARNLGLHRGDEIRIATVVPEPETGEWRVNNRDFVITGSFRTGDNETDRARIYLDRRELADLLGDTRQFTQVLVRLHDYARDGRPVSRALAEELAERNLILGPDYSDLEVRTWEEFRGNLLGAIENERALMGIMLGLVLVVAGFTIFAILSMMVTEKRRDIGILCALGATPRGILELFLMIAFWDALIGAIAGAVAGTWAAIEIDGIERWLSRTLGYQIFNREVYLFDHIPSIVQPVSVGLIVLGAFVCALLFAAAPAWRAARLDPLAALRYE